MKYIQSWQAKTLATIGLMVFGMLIRDAVLFLFKSFWTTITTDITAAASLTVVLIIFALVMSIVMKNGTKGQNNGNQNYQNHNRG